MKQAIAIAILCAATQLANAGTSEFICQSVNGVGLTENQKIRMDGVTLKLTRFPANGNLGIYLQRNDQWELTGAYEPEGGKENEYFLSTPLLMVGSYFALNLTNMRFSYSESIQYLKGTQYDPFLFIGYCKKTRN